MISEESRNKFMIQRSGMLRATVQRCTTRRPDPAREHVIPGLRSWLKGTLNNFL